MERLKARMPLSTHENLRHRAQQFMQARQWPAAQSALEALLQLVPHDVTARMELAQALLAQGRFQASGHQLLQATTVPPHVSAQDIRLVQRLFFSGEIVVARERLDRMQECVAESSSPLFALAQLRWTLGEFDAATQLMDRAATIGLDAPEQYHLHAVLLQVTGNIARAARVLDDCLQRWPDFGDAASTRSSLSRQTPDSNHVDALHAQLRRFRTKPANIQTKFARAEFESALFKELDDLGRYDNAWQALLRSNDLMSALNPYDGAGEATVNEALVDVADSLGEPQTKTTHAGPTPIFIVGMPRSGTTLLDRMLSSHSQVASAGEINDFLHQLHWAADVPPMGVDGILGSLLRGSKIDFAQLGQRYLTQTQWRAQGRRFYIDKLPGNIQMVPFIRRALPQAPILHMTRNPMDVCFSNFRAMFGNVSAYSYDMQALVHYYGLYRRLVDEWHRLLPGAMLDVSYTALIRKPADVLRDVLRHCGLDEEEACLHPERNPSPVATPSSMQVREPIHTRGLSTWQAYAHQLEPMRRMLGRLA